MSWVEQAGCCLVAFGVGSGVTLLELTTTQYPHTYFLIRRSFFYWLYGCIYGGLAAIAYYLLDVLKAEGFVTIEGIGVDNPLVQAAVLGFSTKALLHIRLWSVGTGPDPFPVGTETLVQLFQPWILMKIRIFEWNGVSTYLVPKAEKYADDGLETIKAKLNADLPPLEEQARVALAADIVRCNSISDCFALYLRRAGQEALNRQYPD